MAIEKIGAAGMTVQIKQTYDRILLERALPELVHLNYALVKDLPAKGGKSIEWRKMTSIPAGTTALTEGTPPSATNATFTTVAVTISQYGQYSQISDMLETQGFDPVVEEFAQNFGEAMGNTLDIVARTVIVAGTTIQYASTATVVNTSGAGAVGSGMFIDAAEIREVVSTLKRQNVKPAMDGKYIAIIHPDVTRDLFADTNIVGAFKDAQNRGDANPLFTGVLGDYMGVRFVETTNAYINPSAGMSGSDVYHCVFLGKDAFASTKLSALQAGMVIHPRGTGGHTDPLEQYMTVGWKAALGVKILDETKLVNLLVNTSRSTAA